MSKNFDSGVSRYVIGTATVVAHFPVDRKGNADICCEQCSFYHGRRCALNNEVCNYPSRYRGEFCPLEFEEEDP